MTSYNFDFSSVEFGFAGTSSETNQIPKQFQDQVRVFTAGAKKTLESGETWPITAMVGNTRKKTLSPVIDFTGDLDTLDMTIRLAMHACDADYVFIVAICWVLPEEMLEYADKIVAEYGSIADSPYAVGACSFSLETAQGIWLAFPKIKPLGNSPTRRTLGKVEYRHVKSKKGLLCNYFD